MMSTTTSVPVGEGGGGGGEDEDQHRNKRRRIIPIYDGDNDRHTILNDDIDDIDDDRRISNDTRRVIVDHEFVNELKSFVKHKRTRALTEEERVDILMLQAHLRYEYEQIKKTNRKGLIPPPNASETVAKILGRNLHLVKRIWSEYIKERKISVAQIPVNNTPRKTAIPDTSIVLSKIEAFMHDRSQMHERTFAKDILEFLVKEGYVHYNLHEKVSRAAGVRAVQRFLLRGGFKEEEKKDNRKSKLKLDERAQRNNYVARMVAEVKTKTRRIVYMDESYVYEYSNCHGISPCDLNDEADLRKEKWYCFIAAIIDADYTVPAEQRTEALKAGLMKETVDIFEGGAKRNKNYHGMFNHNYFVNWAKRLLDTLEMRGINNAIIVMDNAKYHRTLPELTPKGYWKKEKLLEKCNELNLEVPQGELLKAQVWEVLYTYIKNNIHPIISTMAKAAGHEVIYSPPDYSELQPIEDVFANIKAEVGRQCTSVTTFKRISEILKAAFDNLESLTVQHAINKANDHLYILYNRILNLEEDENNSDEDFSEDDE